MICNRRRNRPENCLTRMPAVPLITCDPYFSIWSGSDRLYETDAIHWSGKQKRISGITRIDGKAYRFMGMGEIPPMKQTEICVTAINSRYCFEAAGVELILDFWTPLLLDDPDIMSRPCSYLDMWLCSKDGKEHQIELEWEFSGALCCNTDEQVPEIGGGRYVLQHLQIAWMGRKKQQPLGHSGDDIAIDWGYLYLAAENTECTAVSFRKESYSLHADFRFRVGAGEARFASLIAAYDDIASINYFGRFMPGYWARDGLKIQDVMISAASERGAIKRRCEEFEQELEKSAGTFGPAYIKICSAAYRQSIAAHKLIADENGQLVFISKECHSNGCAATVDVTYPSVALYFLYNPELVLGMLRPIFKFAKLPVWEYDFAPHDVGRYPYVTGQVYGVKDGPTAATSMKWKEREGYVYPMIYQMPQGVYLYEAGKQMPVEESADVLILAAQLVRMGNEKQRTEIFKNLSLLKKWVSYLLKSGLDPGEQLCTDDFGGRLAHNVNLAVKAAVGIEAYSILMRAVGEEDKADSYHEEALRMAKEIYERSVTRDGHTKLTFDGPEESWSLKYNAVWDRVFNSKLWSEDFYSCETEHYRTKHNRYGIPLDSRKTYTKSDWLMWWAACSMDMGTVEEFSGYILKFLEESEDRLPFSDWYYTENGKKESFQNRTVQGGIFMPLFVRNRIKQEEMWVTI